MTTIARPCAKCQTIFDADSREIRRGNGKYCSRSCSAKSRGKATPKEPNRECAWCGKRIYRRIESKSGLYFCSKEHQNLSFVSPEIPIKPGPTGHPYRKPPFQCCWLFGCQSHTYEYYCQTHKNIESLICDWLNGDNEATLSGRHQSTALWVKKMLVWIRGDRCEECGFDEKHPTFGTSIIQMDHRDGNSTNNLIENLRLLCPNHHAMTDTYGSRNKAVGRHHRRMSIIKMELEAAS